MVDDIEAFLGEERGLRANEKYLGKVVIENLLSKKNSSLEIINPWHQAGAETYCTDFIVRLEDGNNKHLIAKACIKFAPGETMKEWLGRRTIVQKAGLSVPELVCVDGATIVEEFIPLSFKEAYMHSSANKQQIMKNNFINTYKTLVEIGFSPLSLHDVRSHGDDVVVIDFGNDLGPPSFKEKYDPTKAEHFFSQ